MDPRALRALFGLRRMRFLAETACGRWTADGLDLAEVLVAAEGYWKAAKSFRPEASIVAIGLLSIGAIVTSALGWPKAAAEEVAAEAAKPQWPAMSAIGISIALASNVHMCVWVAPRSNKLNFGKWPENTESSPQSCGCQARTWYHLSTLSM